MQTEAVEYHREVFWIPDFFYDMPMMCPLAYTQTVNLYYMYMQMALLLCIPIKSGIYLSKTQQRIGIM